MTFPPRLARELAHAGCLAAELRRQGAVPVGSTPEEAIRSFEREVRFWAEATKLAGDR